MSFIRVGGAGLFFCALVLALNISASAQPAVPGELAQAPPRAAPTVHVQVQSLPTMNVVPAFDPIRATDRYLARISAADRARSDAYFQGGYWLLLVDLVYALVIAALLLWLKISVWIRNFAQEMSHSPSAQALTYTAIYLLLVGILTLPLAYYEGFVREHAYGLSNQNFLGWFSDSLIHFGVSFIAALIFVPILYAIMRQQRRSWWIIGACVAILFEIVAIAVWPVLIAPFTNRYTALPPSPLEQQIISQARANGIPADKVWLVDASRQSNRISANVSGFLGTTRITLNDNLLDRSTPDEVLAVVGHEMGHYVMGHVLREILLMGLVIIAGFAFVDWFGHLGLDIFGAQWQVRRLTDIASLPLLVALASIFIFLMTPVTNTISRTAEYQADIFGLDAIRKPDAFATVILKLSTYRKLDPGKWEEIIFYDHPSGRTRIFTAMRWKKEHIADPDIRNTADVP